MEKIDYRKVFKEFYNPPKKPVIVDIPEFNFIMIDGKGDPNKSQEYQDALQTLYGMSYTLKFNLKKAGRVDYKVMPLEGLWWVDGDEDFFTHEKDNWSWTSMIMQPEPVNEADVAEAKIQLREKKNPPALSKIRFESFKENLVVQIMYLGPYAEEQPTIERIHSFVVEEGYSLRDKHHEIYIGDPRRTTPEKLRTVIRQPIE
jgi:hypothetical protein